MGCRSSKAADPSAGGGGGEYGAISQCPSVRTDKTPVTSNVAGAERSAAGYCVVEDLFENGTGGLSSAVPEMIGEASEEEDDGGDDGGGGEVGAGAGSEVVVVEEEEEEPPPADPDEAGRNLHELLRTALLRGGGGVGDDGARGNDGGDAQQPLWSSVVRAVESDPTCASYVDPGTGAAALHLACAALDVVDVGPPQSSSPPASPPASPPSAAPLLPPPPPPPPPAADSPPISPPISPPPSPAMSSLSLTLSLSPSAPHPAEEAAVAKRHGSPSFSSATQPRARRHHHRRADGPVDAVRSLARACPEAASREDSGGNLPLHYALVPAVPPQRTREKRRPGDEDGDEEDGDRSGAGSMERWSDRAEVIRLLVAMDPGGSGEYLRRKDVKYDGVACLLARPSSGGRAPAPIPTRTGGGGRCSPLYAAVLSVPDDFLPASGRTVEYVRSVHESYRPAARGRTPPSAAPNASDGDSPLALLYRRFSRQFDRSEKFFPGDNSRPEVVEYRQRYKSAAMNTWRIVKMLLEGAPPAGRGGEGAGGRRRTRRKRRKGGGSSIGDSRDSSSAGRSQPSMDEEDDEDSEGEDYVRASDLTVHSAAAVACPPDLLRYIVETNAERVRERDGRGRTPLHVAAAAAGWSGSGSVLGSSTRVIQREAEGEVQGGRGRGGEQRGESSFFPAYHSKFVIDELLYSHADAAALSDDDNELPLHLAIEAGASWIGGGVKSLFDAYPEALDDYDLSSYPAIMRHVDHVLSKDEREGGSVEVGEDGEGHPATEVETEEHHDAVMLVQRRDAPLSDVVSAMWANEEDGAVQLLGCMSVARFAEEAAASDDDNGDEDGPLVSVAILSLTAVVNAMKNHPNEPAVQEAACRALRTLALADGRRELSTAASGALASAVAAMQAHVSDAMVQSSACAALSAAVRRGGADRATVVASVSGMTAVLNAMGAHPEDWEVQAEACGALEALMAHGGGANLPEIKSEQAGPLLRAAAERFPAECKERAAAVIGRLS